MPFMKCVKGESRKARETKMNYSKLQQAGRQWFIEKAEGERGEKGGREAWRKVKSVGWSRRAKHTRIEMQGGQKAWESETRKNIQQISRDWTTPDF